MVALPSAAFTAVRRRAGGPRRLFGAPKVAGHDDGRPRQGREGGGSRHQKKERQGPGD